MRHRQIFAELDAHLLRIGKQTVEQRKAGVHEMECGRRGDDQHQRAWPIADRDPRAQRRGEDDAAREQGNGESLLSGHEPEAVANIVRVERTADRCSTVHADDHKIGKRHDEREPRPAAPKCEVEER